jgi:nucleotide-binding universal stress UspA family protein
MLDTRPEDPIMIRFKKILCPVDFFETSSRSVKYAKTLAANYQAAVHVLHVVAPVISSVYGAPFSVANMTEDLEKEARRLLEKFKKGPPLDVPVTTEVALGDIATEILLSVQRQKADLVVMGTHGRRGFERFVMGSTTERLIRRCPVPLITIGSGKKGAATPPNIKRILVTTDFSEGTADAIDYALSIAQECQAKLTLLHVLNDVASDVIGTYRDSLVHGIESQLQKLIPEEALNWCDAEIRVEIGLPWKLIPAIVRSGKFDLLVMNVHGKSLIDRALIGSTAERALRTATEICPVMLVPPGVKRMSIGQQAQKRRRKVS